MSEPKDIYLDNAATTKLRPEARKDAGKWRYAYRDR